MLQPASSSIEMLMVNILGIVLAEWFEMGHGGSIYTIKTDKYHKSGLPQFQSLLLSIYEHTTASGPQVHTTLR